MAKRAFRVVERPRGEDYLKTLAAQRELLEGKIANPSLPDILMLVEHEHIYTAGRGTLEQEIIEVNGQHIPCLEVGRGGKLTYHGPGQLVVYPIFDLHCVGCDVHRFLRLLESAVIQSLAMLGFRAFQRPGFSGVWVEGQREQKKIASLGIGVRRWVSYHGLALNVAPDLRYFRAISPCGEDGRIMTSLAEQAALLNISLPTMSAVSEALINALDRCLKRENTVAEAELTRPPWLKVKAPGSPTYLQTRELVKQLKLNTVCQEAQCPNIGECWSNHTATFMIMGDRCTRRCAFCAVKEGSKENLQALDPLEPFRVGRAVAELGLKHVVITSVNRDDLPDMGAAHYHQTVKAIRAQCPQSTIELLIPDLRGNRELLEIILRDELVSIINHNVETVPRLYRTVRPGAQFKRSLSVLARAKELQPQLRTKSGLMVGLGESKDEVLAVMDALRAVNCDILTIGQYLQPTSEQLPLVRFITTEEFAYYKEEALHRGFSFVESGTFVRSSYHAWKHAPVVDKVPQKRLSLAAQL